MLKEVEKDENRESIRIRYCEKIVIIRTVL